MWIFDPGAKVAVVVRRHLGAGDERGAGLVEYVLLVSLITMVSLVVLAFLGGSVRAIYVAIGERLFTA